MNDYWDVVGPSIPEDVVDQYTDWRMISRFLREDDDLVILDLGCGEGKALEKFRDLNWTIQYHGIDTDDSPEGEVPQSEEVRFSRFDGRQIPYPDNFFDFVYVNHFLNRVEAPPLVLREVARVLKPTGRMIGTVSQMAPADNGRLWSFTLYGLCRMMGANGMKMAEMRPGIDAMTLLLSAETGQEAFYEKYYTTISPQHRRIWRKAEIADMPVKDINHRLLQFCGHICFIAKPFSSSRERSLGPQLE